MRAVGARRAPVVDERGCLCGILALDDIYDHLSQRMACAVAPIRADKPARSLQPQPGMMGIDRI
jgi:hypothetical protein